MCNCGTCPSCRRLGMPGPTGRNPFAKAAPTAHDWRPGTLITDDVGERFFIVEVSENTATAWVAGASAVNPSGNGFCLDYLKGARRLLVIDPEDREQVERLYDDYGRRSVVDRDHGIGNMQDALRAMLAPPKPPKPAEPMGLGAVVVDERGVRWVRVESAKGLRNPWQATLHPAEPDAIRSLSYAAIDAVEVLSQGITS